MVLHGGMGVPGLVCRVRLGRAEEQGLREKVTAMVPQIKQHGAADRHPAFGGSQRLPGARPTASRARITTNSPPSRARKSGMETRRRSQTCMVTDDPHAEMEPLDLLIEFHPCCDFLCVCLHILHPHELLMVQQSR